MQTAKNSRNVTFWLDAAALTLEDLAAAEQSGDTVKIRAAFKILVSVSCQYQATADDGAAQMMAKIDARLAQQGVDPALLRAAFRAAHDSPLWATGDYAHLANSAQQTGAK